MQPSASITSFEIRRELERKSLHLPGLLVPFTYRWFPKLTILVLGAMSLIYYVSELRRVTEKKPLPVIGFLTDKLTRSDHLDMAPIYLAVGLGVATIFLPFKAAVAGALLVCLCDAVAAVVGMKFGHHRIMWIRKTYLGTGAFLVMAILVLLPLLGWRGALITAVAASLIEAFSIEGIDNLLLPIFGGFLAGYFL